MRAVLCMVCLAAVTREVCLAEEVWNLEKLAPGVYAALQPREQRFNDSNSVILLGERNVVVIDSQATLGRVRQLITELRKLTDKPVRYVINTHWHGDHTDGNLAWREAFPDVDFIAHHTVKDEMLTRAAPYREDQIRQLEEGIVQAEERLRLKKAIDGGSLGAEEEAALPGAIQRARERLDGLREIKTVLPTLTYEEQLVLHHGGRELRLLHFVAHTRGDTVVYLPQEKLLVSGDVVDELPFGGHGYPASWIGTLDQLEDLDVVQIVPGHGSVLRGMKHLELVRDLLRSLSEQMAPLVAAGKGLEEARARVDFERFRPLLAGDDAVAGRNFDAFLPALVERIYLEARGELE